MRSLSQFIEELTVAGVDVVVDVRENAWSYKAGFSKRAFSEGLAASGIEYVHARFAGNPKEIRDAAESHEACLNAYAAYLSTRPVILEELTQLLAPMLEAGKRPCLVCYERHPADCHRSVLLAQWVRALGTRVSVEHLAPEGAERFSRREVPAAG